MKESAIQCPLQHEVATQALARRLAKTQPGPAMVHLEGALGAGKSTLARAFLRTLGVTGAVPSPTYTVMERYQTQAGEVVHLDLYRIVQIEELEFLGVDEIDPWLWLVEWPPSVSGGLPPVDLHIRLCQEGAGRLAVITAKNALGQMWLGCFERTQDL